MKNPVTTLSSKEDNHGNALDWIAMTFNNSNNVVKVNDKQRGKISLKGLIDCTFTNAGANVAVKFDLNLLISSKDKQVTLSMPKITSNDGWNYPRNEEQAAQVKACLNKEIISPLEQALTK